MRYCDNEIMSFSMEVCKMLNLKYEEIKDLSVSEVDEIYRKRQYEEFIKTSQNHERRRRLELLLPDYEKLYEMFGENLHLAFAYASESLIYTFSDNPIPGFDYESEEMKSLGMMGKHTISAYSCRKKYRKMDSWEHYGDYVLDALAMTHKQFMKYRMGSYDDNKNDRIVKILINMSGYEEEYDEEYEGPSSYAFYARFMDLVNGDIHTMINTHLSRIGFFSIKSKDDKGYIETNNIMSSPEMTEFFSAVKEMQPK